ncbi:MAG: hypothetical protein KDD35_05035, partial [Bdellovibrionales bacterium]|nr:hypothetical protein [Bdellovibrionales bacterium]
IIRLRKTLTSSDVETRRTTTSSYSARGSVEIMSQAIGLIEMIRSNLKSIHAEVNEVYQWSMNMDSGIVHLLNYLTLKWSKKISSIDMKELNGAIDRLAVSIDSYVELEIAWKELSELMTQANGTLDQAVQMQFVDNQIVYKDVAEKRISRAREILGVLMKIRQIVVLWEPDPIGGLEDTQRRELEGLRKKMLYLSE